MSTINTKTFLRRLRHEIGDVPQSIWARRKKLSPSFVNDVLHQRKEPSQTIAHALGYERHVVFRRLNSK